MHQEQHLALKGGDRPTYQALAPGIVYYILGFPLSLKLDWIEARSGHLGGSDTPPIRIKK